MKKKSTNVIKCPRCGDSQPKRADHNADTMYWCSRDQAYFDDAPDEGGDHSDRNPAARLERAERKRRS